MLPNCPQYIIAAFAVLRLGAIVVNINPTYTAREASDRRSRFGHQDDDHAGRAGAARQGLAPQTGIRDIIVDVARRVLVGHGRHRLRRLAALAARRSDRRTVRNAAELPHVADRA